MKSIDFWTGNRVRARAPTFDDIDAFLVDSRDGDAQRFGDEIRLPIHPDALKIRIEKSWSPENDKTWLAIETLDNELVGSINVHEADRRNRNFTYGIAVFRDRRRKGFASEAIALLLRYYFRELGYHRANADVYAFNKPSIELHRRLGFVEEGRVRQSLYTSGEFHDALIFGMLIDEFDALEKTLPEVRLAGGDAAGNNLVV
ncbi:MAG: GNAT family protein [Gammaproteobacteria bacterium]|nr:GNAT family protein [Gammaproteobacteria bacterium]